MKRPHAFLCTFLVLLQAPSAFSQCSANVLISTDSIGNYVFSTNATNDSTAQYYWMLNNDTLPADSNQLQATAHLDSNGTYQICLYVTDTLNQCSFDTCETFTETNAEYIPLLDSINIWHMFENYCPVKKEWEGLNSSHVCYCAMYYTDNDTVVNGISYRNLRSTWYSPPLQGFIREDVVNRKVYFQYSYDSTEIVLYDYAMQVGDSIFIDFTVESNSSGNYRVDSIKTIALSSFTRKVFFLNQTSGIYPRMIVWIEGIGNPQNPLYPFKWNEFGCFDLQCPSSYHPNPNSETFVTCFEHAESVFFDSCAYENALANFCIQVEDPCNYYNICGAIEEIPSLASFTIAPNPASDVFTFTLDVKNNDAFAVSIISLEGKVLKEIDLGKINAGLYSKEISIADFAPGIYLIQCKAASGTLYRKLIVQE